MDRNHHRLQIAPLYADHNGRLSYDAPVENVSYADPREYRLTQAVMVTELNDRQTAHIVSCRDQAFRIRSSARVLDTVGNIEALPESSKVPTVSLGGDYPGLFLHLLAFHRKWIATDIHWDQWSVDLYLALAPSSTDEPYGVVGVFDHDRRCRVYLYACQETGIKLLQNWGQSGTDSLPYVKQSTLPLTLEGDEPIELMPDLAQWLVGWYALYQATTGNLG